ncbi:MAG: carboxylesterase/lipase family protein [Lachnospiraceae bacterium]|nr:carboxylesterase/lipase family protein [Lachnospiraceae bacterium]
MSDHTVRPVVRAKTGSYVGVTEPNGTHSFRGIRFATFNPWERPVIVPESDACFEADTYGPSSASGDPGSLTLAIYLNPETDDPKKKVYFWQFGSAQMGGTMDRHHYENFVKENPDIIVVTTNHRGNVWGSLDLSLLEGYEEKEELYNASNNLTRLDLLACLQWVHQNIACFGGDPEDITIGGHSSGSNNTTCLLMMPEAYPFFKKALCQASFSCDISLQSRETAKKVAAALFEKLGVRSVDELLSCSREKINEAAGDLMKDAMTGALERFNMENKLFSPVMDDVVLKEDCFKNVADGVLKDKILMFGNNSGEYDQQYERFIGQEDGAEKALAFTIEQNWGKLSERGWNKAHAQDVINAFMSHNTLYGRDAFTAAKDLKNDLYLRDGAMLFALAAAPYNKTYMYYLDWSIEKENGKRAAHGSENDIVARRWENVPENMLETADTLSRIFASFILTGDPVPEGEAIELKTFDRENFETLYIDENPRAVHGVRREDAELLMPLLREYPMLP